MYAVGRELSTLYLFQINPTTGGVDSTDAFSTASSDNNISPAGSIFVAAAHDKSVVVGRNSSDEVNATRFAISKKETPAAAKGCIAINTTHL